MATAAIAHPPVRGCRIIALRQLFLNELGRADITRESVTSVRFPYQRSAAEPNSMDLPEGVTMQPLCDRRTAAVLGPKPFIRSSRPTPDPLRHAIVGEARPARSCAPCSKRPRAPHMLRRRSDVSSLTGDRALQDDPTLKADPLCRSIGGLSCSWEWPDTMFADIPEGRFRFCSYRFRHPEARSRSCPFGTHDEFGRSLARQLERTDFREVAAGRRRIGRHIKPRSVCRSIAFDWCCGCVSDDIQSTGRRSVFGEIAGAEAAMICLGMMRRVLNVFDV
jgi:hypothetical protein